MKFYVICLNDSVEYVVVDNYNRAQLKMVELNADYYDKYKNLFDSEGEYKTRCHWHLESATGE